ncbi:MAG: COX15/CtaA family protein [Actinomycetes bacterium]
MDLLISATRARLPLLSGPRALPRWAVASLVANVVIVVTGGLVRLTGSGLGCPTWPRCTDTSFVSHPELGYHGAIEFGNRLLTFVLVAVAVCTWVSALLTREAGRHRRDLRWLAGGLALGIPVQGVIGGITVLVQLNPYLVALHLLVSLGLISLAVLLIRRTRNLRPAPARPAALLAVRAAYGLMWLAVLLGTVVTGSGPHAGDAAVPRTGFDTVVVSHVHAFAVYGVMAATAVAVFLLRSRAAYALLGLEVAQAGIGLLQYHTGLPLVLVALHLLGAALAIALATNLLLSVRPERSPVEVSRPLQEAARR